jgi:hypothetical protein
LPISIGRIHRIAVNNGHFPYTATGNKFCRIGAHAPEAYYHYMAIIQVQNCLFSYEKRGAGKPGSVHTAKQVIYRLAEKSPPVEINFLNEIFGSG